MNFLSSSYNYKTGNRYTESMAGTDNWQKVKQHWENASRKNNANETPNPSACDLCIKTANVVCFDCTKFYCSACHSKLKTANICQNHAHSIVQKDDCRQLICDEHDRVVQVFCISCNLAVCPSCVIGEHNGHEMHAFVLANTTPTDTPERLTKALTGIERVVSEINPLLSEHKMHVASLKDNIRKHKLQLIRQLEDDEAELYSRLTESQTHFEEELLLMKGALAVARNDFEILKQKMETVSKPLPAAPDVSLTKRDMMEVQIENSINEIGLTEYKIPVSPEYWFQEGPTKTQLGIVTDKRQNASPLSYRKHIASGGREHIPT